jgi:hypothetical protein
VSAGLLDRMARFAKSHTVLDMVQKVGGNWTQPIVQARGMARSWDSPLYLGRTRARHKQSRAWWNSQ